MKTALILSGGGAKGSVQFGIFKYLHEQGLRPDAVYGTSVGALNASGYAYQGITGLEKVWGSIKSKSDVFKFNWSTLLFLSKGAYHSKPLRKLLQKNLVGTPQCCAKVCKVNLRSGEIKYGKTGDPDFAESVEASACIPGFNEPIGEWVDGGVREQTPLNEAIRDGATHLVVILCNPWVEDPPEGKISKWPLNVLRTTDIMSHEIFRNDIETCLFYNRNPMHPKKQISISVYAPQQLVIDSLDFTQDKIQPAIKYGYEQAKLGPVIMQVHQNG